jgi:hypothetical protein
MILSIAQKTGLEILHRQQSLNVHWTILSSDTTHRISFADSRFVTHGFAESTGHF